MSDNYVIFDCDPGTDDAWAMMMLIKIEMVFKMFKILAITTVVGNAAVGNTTLNAFRVLDHASRTDIPTYKGCTQSFIPLKLEDTYFGLDGFGDVLPPHGLPSEPHNEGKEGHAVNKIYELVKKYPHKVSLIMAGPLTNLATCITMYDDFLDQVKDIWIMGGDLCDKRHISSKIEFNFRRDAIAAHIVMKNAKVPVYIVPKDPIIDVNEGIDLDFRFGYLGAVDSPFMRLLNRVENIIFVPKQSWKMYDPHMTAAFAFPEKMITKSRKCNASVIPAGDHAGQMIIDYTNEGYTTVIEELDQVFYKKIIAWTAGVPNVELDL